MSINPKEIIIGATIANFLVGSPFCLMFKDCTIAYVSDLPSGAGDEQSSKPAMFSVNFRISGFVSTSVAGAFIQT